MIHAPASTNSPEKQLWLAVLGQMMSDFNVAITRGMFNECEAMVRQMRSEHMAWICDTCDIHPDRFRAYMKLRINMIKPYRAQNNIEFKNNKQYR